MENVAQASLCPLNISSWVLARRTPGSLVLQRPQLQDDLDFRRIESLDFSLELSNGFFLFDDLLFKLPKVVRSLESFELSSVFLTLEIHFLIPLISLLLLQIFCLTLNLFFNMPFLPTLMHLLQEH